MRSLLCSKNGNTFIVTIDPDKTIRYWDSKSGKIWQSFLQWLPATPEENAKKILMGRNRIPAHFVAMLNVPPEEKLEWDNCQDEQAVYDLVVRDLKKNTCDIIKETKT